MSKNHLFIGIDSGTQGTKALIYSESDNSVIAEAYSGYPLLENERGGREQHPKTWLNACRKVIKKVCSDSAVDASNIRAIGVSGQQHGMVVLDAQGEVIRPAKLWCDTETTAECELLTRNIGGEAAVVAETGNHIAAGFTASKLLWLKDHEPENYDRLDTVLLPHDYINFWLTGEKVAEYGDASGTAYFNVRSRGWSEKVLLSIDNSGKLEACLPKLIRSDEPCGVVKNELAEELGLPKGVIVSSGGGDNMMAAIGTGNVTNGVVTASLGTSGTIYGYSDTPVIDSSGELAAFCSSSGGWLPLVCTMNVTVATELTRSLFGYSIEEMEDKVNQSSPGSEGLLLLPYFQGERTPPLPEATATLAGISSINYTPANISRAAMEGATFGLRYGLEVMKRNSIDPSEIRLVGGGAKSAIWRQMVADIFNCQVVTLKNEEAGALGGALQAVWCWKKEQGEKVNIKELTDIAVQLQKDQACQPEPDNVARYAEAYSKYLEFGRKIYDSKGN